MSDFDFKIDVEQTLWKRWSENARNFPEQDAIVHWLAGEEPFRWKFGELVHQAKKYSSFIKEAGVKPGEVCAIIIRHNPQFYPLYLGVSRTAALPAVLAYPNPRLHPDKFRQGIEGMSQRSGLDYILTERELEPLIRPLIEKPGSTIKALFFPLEWDTNKDIDEVADAAIEQEADNVSHKDTALLQHSSGTTGLQKPVTLSHFAISQHVIDLGSALGLNKKDIIANWLPLYHDFGLIAAFHIPLACGIPTIQIDPFQWVLAPVILLEAISKEKATLCCLPNFAYNIMADKIPDDELEGLNLGSLRAVVNGSEPIRHDSHQKFVEKFNKYNFDPLALACIYGMAETTLGVSLTEPKKPITELVVDRNELAQGRVVFANEDAVKRVCVSSGKLIPNCLAKIVDENRKEVGDGLVGEIAVKSISMFNGYRNYPEKTAEVVDEGWYYTGDYGFVHNEEFFIIGRKKDIIIVAGKNIYPEDIEDVVNQAEGIIPGRVIAFGEEDEAMGTEFVAVVAETKAETEADKNAVRLNILKAGMSIDIIIHNVYLVPSRWLIKSSAGKPSRKANKERLLEKKDPLIWYR